MFGCEIVAVWRFYLGATCNWCGVQARASGLVWDATLAGLEKRLEADKSNYMALRSILATLDILDAQHVAQVVALDKSAKDVGQSAKRPAADNALDAQSPKRARGALHAVAAEVPDRPPARASAPYSAGPLPTGSASLLDDARAYRDAVLAAKAMSTSNQEFTALMAQKYAMAVATHPPRPIPRRVPPSVSVSRGVVHPGFPSPPSIPPPSMPQAVYVTDVPVVASLQSRGARPRSVPQVHGPTVRATPSVVARHALPPVTVLPAPPYIVAQAPAVMSRPHGPVAGPRPGYRGTIAQGQPMVMVVPPSVRSATYVGVHGQTQPRGSQHPPFPAPVQQTAQPANMPKRPAALVIPPAQRPPAPDALRTEQVPIQPGSVRAAPS